MKILGAYDNGNTSVILYDDGTKVRECEGHPKPLHPESIDVKITNWCDGACPYCHEQSTKQGKHGNLDALLEALSPLPHGVELALGGGDPTSHPDLIRFLLKAKECGWIVNITINHKHIKSRSRIIKQLLARGLVHGVGISYRKPWLGDEDYIHKLSGNVVYHLIAGVNSPNDLDSIEEICRDNNRTPKVLLLGYKQFGFGLSFYDRNKEVAKTLQLWHDRMAQELKRENFIFSFDNLGIEQMKIKRFLAKETWDEFYMGDDFTFSMYVDAVEGTFAPTSTSTKRVPFDRGLLQFFNFR
jgi:hypothetical protein